jgi:YegS/Rv2252/BmrU family lipid kinase
MQKILFVVNPASGIRFGKQKIVPLIQAIMKPAGLEYDIAFTAGRGDGTRLSRQAVTNGIQMIVAVGGDGTVNEVGQGLLGSDAVLGVIPAGSGNGFARNFNIPLSPQEALQHLLKPCIIAIDAGIINNYYFFNVAGVGLDALISKNFESLGMRGTLSYVLVGIKTFFSYTPAMVTITCPGREINTAPLVLCIANAPQYGSGAIIAPYACPDDGLLDVCFIDTVSFLKAGFNVPRLFNGTIVRMKHYHSFRTDSLTIECSKPCLIHTDGDPHSTEAIVTISVVPGALRVAAGEYRQKADG